ncbi:MAG: SynChlorMet cassette protein ScmD [bacterium]
MATMEKAIINPNIVLREEFDDWALLFDPDTGKTFGLNPISVFIWKQLEEKATHDEIINKIKQEWSKVPASVEKQVNDFIVSLAEKGFVGCEAKN